MSDSTTDGRKIYWVITQNGLPIEVHEGEDAEAKAEARVESLQAEHMPKGPQIHYLETMLNQNLWTRCNLDLKEDMLLAYAWKEVTCTACLATVGKGTVIQHAAMLCLGPPVPTEDP